MVIEFGLREPTSRVVAACGRLLTDKPDLLDRKPAGLRWLVDKPVRLLLLVAQAGQPASKPGEACPAKA
jgi:hypothetical protein